MTTVPIMWTPDTGTTELPAYRRGTPLTGQPTQEIPFWQGTPTLTRYEVARPTTGALVRRVYAGLLAAAFAAPWLIAAVTS